MAWPGVTDFSEAVQNPHLCFRGTDLEAGEVSVNPRGMPLVFSGAFASVYPVSVGDHTFAVRCFTREVKDQQARYGALSTYLLNVLPPSFVHFEYLEHGINVRGSWYPIVRMEWVHGELLNRFVESRLGEPDALRRVAAQWRGGPTASLRGLRIAHNDLQHGNVMVQDDGNIRLVDYDGMFLPQFRGQPSAELGHKHYQHPRRGADDYDENIDNFPSLVIYLSLLAVAADPGLWAFHNEDNLVLTRQDYADPGASEAFARLKGSPDPLVARLVERLIDCCSVPVGEVPDLETVLEGIPSSVMAAAAVSAPPSGPVPTTGPPPRPPVGVPAKAAAEGNYRQTLQERQPASPTPGAPARRPLAPRTYRPVPVPQRTLKGSLQSLASWLSVSWHKLLVGGLTGMFVGWLIQTDAFVSLVNGLLLIVGIIAALIFIGAKNQTALAIAVITLAVRFTNLFDWTVNAVWAWLIVAGLTAVLVGGGTRIATGKKAISRAALAVLLVMAVLWTFFLLTDYTLPGSGQASPGPESMPATAQALT